MESSTALETRPALEKITASLLTRFWMGEQEVLFLQTSYHPKKAFTGPCVKNLSSLGRWEETPWSTMWPGTSAGYPFLENGRFTRPDKIRNCSSYGRRGFIMWWLCTENDFFEKCIYIFVVTGHIFICWSSAANVERAEWILALEKCWEYREAGSLTAK